MNTEELLEKFNVVASQYDRQRRMLIPRFDDFYGTAFKLTECPESPGILDIGAGLLTDLLLHRHPESQALPVGIFDSVLDRARERFLDNPRISFLQMDYSTQLPEGPFDLVVSDLFIHHLSGYDNLMQRVYNILSPGGRFINADHMVRRTILKNCITTTGFVALRRQTEANSIDSIPMKDASSINLRCLTISSGG